MMDKNIESVNDVRIIVTEPMILTMILLLSVIYGFIIGTILKITKYKNDVPDHAWARFCRKNLGKDVIVRMKDVEGKKRIIGKLVNFNDSKDEPSEIVLSEPSEIIQSDSISLKSLGAEIYISASTIQNILKPELKSNKK